MATVEACKLTVTVSEEGTETREGGDLCRVGPGDALTPKGS